jgi:hypothetical protein
LTARKRRKGPPSGGGKPFASALWPYLAIIARLRLQRATWAAIAEEISAAGTPVTAQGVHGFFKRCKEREKRRGTSYALGTEPANAGFATKFSTARALQQESSHAPVQSTSPIDEMIAEAQETTRVSKQQQIKSYKPKPNAQL